MKSIITLIIIAGLTTNLNANNLPKSDKMDRVYTSKECKALRIQVNDKRTTPHNLMGATIAKDRYESMIRELLKLKKELKQCK